MRRALSAALRAAPFVLLLLSGPRPVLAEPEPTPALDEVDDFGFDDLPDPAERDHAEHFNRGVFRLNERLYDYVLTPITNGFRFLIPRPGRDAIRRVISNLRQPVIFANDLLQLAPGQALRTLGRFAMNSTFGLVGIWDPATDVGLAGHDTDFGETLAIYGTPSGSYLVLPVAGPTTVRDGFGGVVDALLRPDVWFLGFGPWVLLDAAGGIAQYDVQEERLDALRSTSVDFYAALRAAYLMDRDAHVAERRRALPWVHDSGPDVEPDAGARTARADPTP